MNKPVTLTVAFCIWACVVANAFANDKAVSLDQLLDQVRQGRLAESQQDVAREREFRENKAQQAQMLANARKEQAALERTSSRLEDEFNANKRKIADQVKAFNNRLGGLKELFGVLQDAAGAARSQFDKSVTNAQFPGRDEWLTHFSQEMNSTSKFASMDQIRRLWYELQREMTESGKVVRFPAKVIMANGDEVEKQVIRVGEFNLVSGGKYLKYVQRTGKLAVLGRQPASRYVQTAEALSKARSGVVTFGLDPTRGQVLHLLIQEPTFKERLEQGGVVGYAAVALGIVGFVIAMLRLFWLILVSVRVAAQKRNPEKPSTDNPLGRVLQAYHQNRDIDIESLELKMGEAVLRETPRLTRFNNLLKVIAVVTPLLGLLGTLVGMIITFQTITLYGTGNPKLMAGGISTALVTTVEGLCVAIPIVLLHTLVAGRSRHLIEILEEQATGVVAEASERKHRGESAN